MKFEDLKIRLKNINAEYEIIHHDIPIKSKMDAAGYFRIEETAPTLIVKTENDLIALIVSGERNKVDLKLISKLLDCKKLAIADRYEVYEKLGFETGQIPLIGHDLPCIIDNMIFKYRYVYGGTGDWFYTLKIRPEDLTNANNVVLRFGD